MNILHISNNDCSGAGLCAYRLHKSMQKEGFNSKMLVLNKTQDDDSVILVFQHRYKLYRLFHALLRKLHLFFCEYDKLVKLTKMYGVPFTRPQTPFDLSNHPMVLSADIIHLHWVDDFFNQPKFFENVRKPIVWTLHDEGMFYGITHYHDIVFGDNPLEEKYRSLKINMTRKANNLHYVILSQYFRRTFGSTPFLREHTFSIISNSVDCTKFHAYDKEESRRLLGLDNSFVYLSFLASDIADAHKGLESLVESLSMLNNDRFRVLAVGNDQRFRGDEKVITMGIIRDTDLLSRVLSASDYFVMPSLQEAFSQAPIEAMACGKPAIVTPVSGTEELITESNGVICENFSPSSIAEGIQLAIKRIYDPVLIREDISNRFSPHNITSQYIKVYESLLER